MIVITIVIIIISCCYSSVLLSLICASGPLRRRQLACPVLLFRSLALTLGASDPGTERAAPSGDPGHPKS